MRAAILVLLLLALASGCTGSQKAASTGSAVVTTTAVLSRPADLPTVAPPGSVGRFPCPKHALTTIAMESCGVRHLLPLHVQINRRIRLIWARLHDATGRRHFQTGEHAWRVYVVNECTARSRAYIDPAFPHQYAGGSGASVRYADCEQELTLAHLRALTTTATQLGPH